LFREKHIGEWAAWTAEKNQLIDMDRGNEALTLMEEATERFRYIPRIYIEKGSVHKFLGDNQNNIACLEKALDLSPSWDWVARELAEAYEFGGDYTKAQGVLRKAIHWAPLNPANGGCLADQLERLGEREEAFDILAKTLKTSPYYDWGWREISSWAKEMDRADDVIKMLKEHHESRAELPSWQECCFNVYDILEKDDEALKFCDDTLEEHPKNIDMHDSKAYLLARLGKVEEALEATEPEIFGDEIPPMLVSRRALIYNQFIDPRKAIEIMKGVYEKHPDWIAAPMYLSRWYFEYGQDDEAEKYTKEWLRLSPQSHLALGQLGSLAEGKKKLKEAAEYYKKAFQTQPEYSYAGYRAFELILKNGDLDDIPQLIQLTQHFGRETEAIEMELRYVEAKGDKAKSFELFDQLLRREDLHIDEIRNVEVLFPKHGAKRIVEIVENGEAKSKALLQAWLWGRSNYMKSAAKIVKLPYSKEMKYPLWCDQIEWLLNMENDEGCLKKLYQKHYQEFNEDTECMASLLQASARFAEYAIGCKIASDLLPKEGLQDWMVTNIAYCEIAQNGLLATEAIIDKGLALRKEHGADFLLGMKSIIEAGRGNLEVAEELLSMREKEMNKGAKDLGSLSEMMIASMRDDKATQKTKWNQFKLASPSWNKKTYYNKILDYCAQCAKKHGKKLVGKRPLLRNGIQRYARCHCSLIC